jgi:hypothetical protein
MDLKGILLGGTLVGLAAFVSGCENGVVGRTDQETELVNDYVIGDNDRGDDINFDGEFRNNDVLEEDLPYEEGGLENPGIVYDPAVIDEHLQEMGMDDVVQPPIEMDPVVEGIDCSGNGVDIKNEADCLDCNGVWRRWGLWDVYQMQASCNIRTSDYGAECSDGSECERKCITECIDRDCYSDIGSCAEFRRYFGCTRVWRDGVQGDIVCSD